MNRFVRHALVVFLGLFLFTFVDNATARADDTVKIAHSTWVGYGPLYIAQSKGFFKRHGVNVDLVVMEDPKERFPTLMADKIQMIASTVDTALLYLKKPTDFQYVVAIDDSNGGDGIVALKDIKSIADLPSHAKELGRKIVGIEPGAGLTKATRDEVFPAYRLAGSRRIVIKRTDLAAILTPIVPA